MSKKGYCVIGIGENGGMGIQCCSENLVGSKQMKEVRETIFDIHLMEEGPNQAFCMKTLENQWVAISKVTRVECSGAESRPHTLQHLHIMTFDDYLHSLKMKMNSDEWNRSFFCGPMEEVHEYAAEGKLDFPDDLQEKRALSVFKGLYQEEKWNLFLNLIYARQKNIKIALGVDESVNREEFMADIYRFLPNDYALNTSMLTAGTCPQTLFHLRFVSNTGEDDLRHYKYVSLASFLRTKLGDKEYPNLKRIVLAPNKLRDEFYASKHMNRCPEYDHLMSFSAMEHAAKNFLEDKKMLTEPEKDFEELKRVVLEGKEMVAELLDVHRRVEKKDRRFEMLLKEILVWRNNELKMGHEVSLWKLDEILRNAGAVPFCSEENSMFDPGKHEVVRISPCNEAEQTGHIAESLAQGYWFQGKVLLKEDVVVYK